MPQIDFGQAFSNSDKSFPSPPSVETVLIPETPAGAQMDEGVESSKFRRSRLGRSEWANIIFAIIAILGGLFFAFYFFNGAELLRAAKSWPREYLYSEPGPPDDAHSDRSRLADSLGLPAPSEGQTAGRASGDPFSRTSDLLNPPTSRLTRAASAAAGTPGSPVTRGPSGGLTGPGSPLSGLGLPAPGGDALKQTFDKAVSDLQRVARSGSQRTINVLQTNVTHVEKRVIGRARNSVKGARAQRMGVNAAGKATSSIGRVPRATSPTTSRPQQTLNSMRGGVSGISRGLGGLNGGGLGGIGGSLGGHGGISGGGRGH